MTWVENVHVLRGPAPFDWADDEPTPDEVAEWESSADLDARFERGEYERTDDGLGD